MFDQQLFTDLKIETSDGLTLKAHKAIVATRAPGFFRIAKKNLRAAKLQIPEFDSTVIKEVLRFMYCNEVENLRDFALKLIVAADQYQMHDLKKVCINSIMTELTTENVIQSLLCADGLEESVLVQACLNFISR
jgi:hypothetical protein